VFYRELMLAHDSGCAQRFRENLGELRIESKSFDQILPKEEKRAGESKMPSGFGCVLPLQEAILIDAEVYEGGL
jgi:hypothetical protein